MMSGYRTILCAVVLATLAGLLRTGVTPTASAERQLYDEEANARQQLAVAKAEAAASGKHLLIVWGANWCGWCHELDRFYSTDPEISRLIADNYVLVRIDLGHRDKNMLLARNEYGLDFNELRIPHTSIRDADGNVIAERQSRAFGDPDDGIDAYLPEKIYAFLDGYKPSKRPARNSSGYERRRDIYDETADARQLVAEAKREAAASGKHVVIVWGANWCGWCHKLEYHFTRNEEIR
ncbi:MAG: thioredoxin family protein, partial [Candidatus Hydrogenedentales bacterium]